MRKVKWSELALVAGGNMAKYRALSLKSAQITAAVDAPGIIQDCIATTVVDGEVRPPVDRGTYRQGWKHRVEGGNIIIYNSAPHAPFMEHGRKPGKFPPWSDPDTAVGGWVRRKLLPAALAARQNKPSRKHKSVSSNQLAKNASWYGVWRGLSFVVARSIAKKGIAPRDVLLRAQPRIYAAWHRNFKAMMKAP